MCHVGAHAIKTRKGDQALVYKTHQEPPQVIDPQQLRTALNEANLWLRDYVDAAVDRRIEKMLYGRFKKVLVEYVCTYVGHRIKKLREEIK
jgi:hypothetical protein